MKTREDLLKNAEQFLSDLDCDVEIMDYIDIEDVDFSDAYSSIFQLIQDNGGFDVEVIYYSNAIEYLSENDPSLQESLEIAAEYGYEVQSLNSELLASLLKSRDVVDDFSEYEDRINEYFEELQEELDEIEENE